MSKLLWEFDNERKMFVAYSKWSDGGTQFEHRFKHTPKGGFVVCSDSELTPVGKVTFSSLAGVVAVCESMEEG